MGTRLANSSTREEVAAPLPAPRGRQAIAVAVSLSDPYAHFLGASALSLTRRATTDDVHTLARGPSVPGIGQILALGLRSESPDRTRVPRGHELGSSWRLVQWATESRGKHRGPSGNKIGPGH
jgi:hypothetical protein